MSNARKSDPEREKALQKIEDYIIETLESYLENDLLDDEDQRTVSVLETILQDMKMNDYGSVYKYLEEEIGNLKKRIGEAKGNEIGEKETIPRCKESIKKLEEIKNNLILPEK